MTFMTVTAPCTMEQILFCNKTIKSLLGPFSGMPQINTKTQPWVFIHKVRKMLDSIAVIPGHTYLQHTLLRKSPQNELKLASHFEVSMFWIPSSEKVAWKDLLPAGLLKLDRVGKAKHSPSSKPLRRKSSAGHDSLNIACYLFLKLRIPEYKICLVPGNNTEGCLLAD